MPVLEAMLVALLVLLGVDSIWRLVLLVAGLLPHKPLEEPAAAPPPTRFLVLIPAHDEERHVGRAVESVRGAGDPGPSPAVRGEAVVVADHCTDGTAETARGRGATVLERRDGSPGKGEAVGWALARLDLEGFDAVLLLDADSCLARGALLPLARVLSRGRHALQMKIEVENPGESWLTRLAHLTLLLRFGPLAHGRERLRLHAIVTGDGLVLSRESLRRVPWRAGGLVEGGAHQCDLAEGGMRPVYVGEACLATPMPARLPAARTQRTRWSAGRVRLALRRALPLLGSALAGRDAGRAELACDLLRPSPSIGVLLLLAALALAAALPLPHADNVLGAALLILLLQAVPWLVALFLAGGDPRNLLAFLGAPVYLLFKAWVVVGGALRGPRRFVRTERD